MDTARLRDSGRDKRAIHKEKRKNSPERYIIHLRMILKITAYRRTGDVICNEHYFCVFHCKFICLGKKTVSMHSSKPLAVYETVCALLFPYWLNFAFVLSLLHVCV